MRYMEDPRSRNEAGHLVARRDTSLRMPSSVADLAYLAGIFDGEGSVRIMPSHRQGSQRNAVRISITNTDEGLIEWLREIGGNVSVNHHRPKVCYAWQISARADVVCFLSALLPYLRIKREKSETALAHARSLLAVAA